MRKHWAGRVALALTIVASTSTATMAVMTSAAHAAASDCGITTWNGFSGLANNKWVSAEVNYPPLTNGMLRSRASVQGPWEKFKFTRTSDGHIAIQSLQNHKYVSADLGYNPASPDWGLLVAHATKPQAWEKFDAVSGAFGCSLRSVANGRYVSVEMNYANSHQYELRARATAIGPWEIFEAHPLAPQPQNGPLTFAQVEGYWIKAGGPASQAARAAATAGRESGLYPGQIQFGPPPYNVTGWGLWQITPGTSVSQFCVDYALLDPWNNAEAAVAKYNAAHGWGPWNGGVTPPNPAPAPVMPSGDPGQFVARGNAPAGTHNTSQPGSTCGPAMP
jgi:hypothetical protein